jgi:GTP-binding protein
MEFVLTDTAGLHDFTGCDVALQASSRAACAGSRADLILFVIDTQDGLSATDLDVASTIRKIGKTVILIANKCDRQTNIENSELLALGFGTPSYFSATESIGLHELRNRIATHFQQHIKDSNTPISQDIKNEIDDRPDNNSHVRVALVGRPNAGKSTLFNSIVRENRVITSEHSGTTREIIEHVVKFEGHSIAFLDTPGLRRKRRIKAAIEKIGAAQSITAVRIAHIIVLVLDITRELSQQDANIMNTAAKEGKCIIALVNKCDTITNSEAAKAEVRKDIQNKISNVSNINIVFTSALKRKDHTFLLPTFIELYNQWSKKFPTKDLNLLLQKIVEQRPPPAHLSNNRRLKLKYIVQVSTRPQRFKIFCNAPHLVPGHYARYVKKCIIRSLKLDSIAVRTDFTSSRNPYRE